MSPIKISWDGRRHNFDELIVTIPRQSGRSFDPLLYLLYLEVVMGRKRGYIENCKGVNRARKNRRGEYGNFYRRNK